MLTLAAFDMLYIVTSMVLFGMPSLYPRWPLLLLRRHVWPVPKRYALKYAVGTEEKENFQCGGVQVK